jgi:hypothetical protein
MLLLIYILPGKIFKFQHIVYKNHIIGQEKHHKQHFVENKTEIIQHAL